MSNKLKAIETMSAPQDYKGNGKHNWESVIDINNVVDLGGTNTYENTMRLRVPGGWLYRTESVNAMDDVINDRVINVTFVPMPATLDKFI